MKQLALLLVLLPFSAGAPLSAQAIDDEQTVLRELNKRYMIDFISYARRDDLKEFYRANPQFGSRLSQAEFVNKFRHYKELPDDLTAIKGNNFSTTQVAEVENNTKYKKCDMVEARSSIPVEVADLTHIYKMTNRYCRHKALGGTVDYKLVSFKFGYEEQ